MPSIEDKVALFNKVLFDKVENDYEKKRNEIIEKYKKRKEELLKKKEETEKSLIDISTERAEEKKKQMISKALHESNFKVLKEKREIEERFFKCVINSSSEFVKTKLYSKYLLFSVSKATNLLIKENLIFYFTKDDILRYGDMIKSILDNHFSGYLIKEADSTILGGFYIENNDRSKRFDFTLKTLFEENRNLINKKISDILFK